MCVCIEKRLLKIYLEALIIIDSGEWNHKWFFKSQNIFYQFLQWSDATLRNRTKNIFILKWQVSSLTPDCARSLSCVMFPHPPHSWSHRIPGWDETKFLYAYLLGAEMKFAGKVHGQYCCLGIREGGIIEKISCHLRNEWRDTERERWLIDEVQRGIVNG